VATGAKKAVSTTADSRKTENNSLNLLLIATPVVAIIVLILNQLFNGGAALTITGRPSIALYVTPLIMLVVLAMFVWQYVRQFSPRRVDASMYRRRWVVTVDALSLGIVYMLAAGAISIWSARIFANSFIGLSLDQYTASFLIGLSVGIASYAMSRLTARISSKQTVNVIGLFLVGGVIVSMLTTQEPDWWQANFSTLGQATQKATASYYIFNLTLILSGFALVVLARQVIADAKEVFVSSKDSSKNRLRTVQVFMIIAALGLAGVGLFPYTPDSYKAFMHVFSAGLVAISFGVMIGLLKWLLPSASKQFMVLSYAILASLVGAYVLYARVGYLSLTSFELGCFGICFGWLYLFTQQVVTSKEYNRS